MLCIHCRGQTKHSLNSSQIHIGERHWLSHNRNREKASGGKALMTVFCYCYMPWGSRYFSRIQCTCFSLQSSTPSSISCCFSRKPSSKVLIWPSTYSLSLCPRFLEERERKREMDRGYTVPSLLRKHRPSLLWSLRWRNPIFKGPQCSRNPNGKIEE